MMARPPRVGAEDQQQGEGEGGEAEGLLGDDLQGRQDLGQGALLWGGGGRAGEGWSSRRQVLGDVGGGASTQCRGARGRHVRSVAARRAVVGLSLSGAAVRFAKQNAGGGDRMRTARRYS
jgi:hypothetical protein